VSISLKAFIATKRGITPRSRISSIILSNGLKTSLLILYAVIDAILRFLLCDNCDACDVILLNIYKCNINILMYSNIINTVLDYTKRNHFKLTRSVKWEIIENEIFRFDKPKKGFWYSIDMTTAPHTYNYGFKELTNIYDYPREYINDEMPWL